MMLVIEELILFFLLGVEFLLVVVSIYFNLIVFMVNIDFVVFGQFVEVIILNLEGKMMCYFEVEGSFVVRIEQIDVVDWLGVYLLCLQIGLE